MARDVRAKKASGGATVRSALKRRSADGSLASSSVSDSEDEDEVEEVHRILAFMEDADGARWYLVHKDKDAPKCRVPGHSPCPFLTPCVT